MKLLITLLLVASVAGACAPLHVRQHVGSIEVDGRHHLAKGRCSGITPIARSGPFEIILGENTATYTVNGNIVVRESFAATLDKLTYQYDGEPPKAVQTTLTLTAIRGSYGKGAEPARELPSGQEVNLQKSGEYPYRHIGFQAEIPRREKGLRITLPRISVDGALYERKTIDFEFLDEWRIVPLNGC